MDSEFVYSYGPAIVFGGLVLALLVSALWAYNRGSRKSTPTKQRRAYWVGAAVAALVAFVATAEFAVPITRDFRNPEFRHQTPLLEVVIVWLPCVAVWIVALWSIFRALRKERVQ
jgi:CDP-diglyceride synthetase